MESTFHCFGGYGGEQAVVVGAWIALLVATFGDERAREALKDLGFPTIVTAKPAQALSQRTQSWLHDRLQDSHPIRRLSRAGPCFQAPAREGEQVINRGRAFR